MASTAFRIAIGSLLISGLAPGAARAEEAPKVPPVPPPETATELPPRDLLRMVRQARIAETIEGRDAALKKLREAAEAFPHELLPVALLWSRHRGSQIVDEEATRFRALLVARLADAESPLPRGTLSFLGTDPDSDPEELALVVDALSKRLASRPDDVALLETLFSLEQRLERVEDARATVGRLLELQPSVALRWRCLSLDRELERWDSAAEQFRAILESGSRSTALTMSYIEVLARAGNYDEVIRQLEQLEQGEQALDLRLAGSVAALGTLLLQVAWDLRDAGQVAPAEKIFRRLLALDPENAAARAAVLHLYSSEAERQAHQSALEGKWRLEEDPHSLLEQGAALLASGDARGAFEFLERAAPNLPDSEIAWYNLGLASLSLERWEIAERAFAHAVALNPSRADSLLNRGAALQSLGRCGEAIPLLKRVLEMEPGQSRSHYYLYLCYKEAKNLAGAMEELRLYDERKQ